MKSSTLSFLFFLFFYLLVLPCAGQQIKLVTGTVVDKETGKPFVSEVVDVYAFYTVAEAEDMKKLIDSHSANVTSSAWEKADPFGYYEIRVPDNGAIIYKVGVAPCVLEKVNGRMEINVAIDAGILLTDDDGGDLTVVGEAKTITLDPLPPVIIGDKMFPRNTFPIIKQYGRSNARLIIQPFLIDCVTDDTVSFLKPLVFDGEQYHTTQDRRMNFDLSYDPLARFVNDSVRLSTNSMLIPWADTVRVPNPDHNYHVDATIQLEDYADVYYTETFLVSTCEARRPLKFLEYSIGNFDLNPNDYYIRPKREKVPTAANISLTFLVSRAELDPDNPDNERNMNKLRQSLLDIVNGEGTTLKEFHLTSYSSPEGNFQSNKALALRRVQFAQRQATSLIPSHVLQRVYQNPQAEVAPWTEMADSLEADSLFKEAAEIRNIVEKYPKSIDNQYRAIARLPYYATTIKAYLPKLRRVHFRYVHEIYRELTAEEIYDRYLHDPDYKSGKKQFALYEYWHLFKMEKDPMKLRKLYKDAYELSKKAGQPWVFAANKLAISYLDADTADLSILEPFIDVHKPLNWEDKMDGVVLKSLNKPEVVANQLAMYLKLNRFSEASVLAQMLPKEEFKIIRAFTLCLGGYYQPNTHKESKEIFNIVKSSTPVNEVVMWLALDNPSGDAQAERSLNALEDTNPLKWYFKGIISSRKKDLYMATYNLAQCFKLDTKYIEIAQQDGDLDEDAVADAVDQYEFL